MTTGAPTQPIRFYRAPLSGHAHRVQLFLSLLALPYEIIDVSIPNGENRRPEFLALSPFGQVPVIQDGDVVLYDSNAILMYLALKYDTGGRWLPRDPLGAAAVQQWLSMAAGPIASGVCAVRLVTVFGVPLDYERSKVTAQALLKVVDGLLQGKSFALGDEATIADVAAFSYIEHAPEGGVSLEPYPNVRAWLPRVRALPRFVPMAPSKASLLAE